MKSVKSDVGSHSNDKQSHFKVMSWRVGHRKKISMDNEDKFFSSVNTLHELKKR